MSCKRTINKALFDVLYNLKRGKTPLVYTYLSGCRESNPDRPLPKRKHYHYATPRVNATQNSMFLIKSLIIWGILLI